MTLCGTELHTSTAFHPQTQGLTELANDTIIYSLKHDLHLLYETWDDISSRWSLQTTPPFEALCGFNPCSPLMLSTHTYLTPYKASKDLEVLRSRIDGACNPLRTQLLQAQALNSHTSPHTLAQG